MGNKVKEFARNYYIVIVLTVLLLTSTVCVLKTQNELNKYVNGFLITGTYILGNELTGEAEYLAFTLGSEDEVPSYCRYKQFDLIEKGVYEKGEDANLYLLSSSSSDIKRNHILVSKEKIYFFLRREK